jgi:transcription initiation factor TFIID/TFIIF subunit
MRSWNIEIWLLDEQGNEVLPTVYEKAVYNLHPSFEKNKQSERAEHPREETYMLMVA